jgi:opacity protein-like surface antigen
MFVGRYGFLPDSEVPFGRLQPYIAVGPAVFFSGQSSDDMGSASSTDVALVVESGIRYMALKNVSINLAFRYRYVRPTYTYNGIILGSVTQTQTFNLFNAILGVSYHF